MIQSGIIDSYIWILKKQLIYSLILLIKRLAEILDNNFFFAGLIYL